MKKSTLTLAALLPSIAAMAIVPQEQQAQRDPNPQFSKNLSKIVKKASDSENVNSFFEGFEGRNPDAYGFAANAWLPSGWSQFSRQGNKHVGSGDGYWDLTWLTLSNESVGSLPSGDQRVSYDGDSFAYIMADVMWGEKLPYPDLGLDYATNHPQDEWLVSPAFTPKAEEWFYFQLNFRPGWCLYNRQANDFTGENNLLEVWVTEGNGTTNSDWVKLWSLKDYIGEKFTEEELRADLTDLDGKQYRPVYVNMKNYVGKNVKVAFRFFGVNGQGMALDNVALGIPIPKPSYVLPNGFFKQQSLTPTMQEISGTPQLMIPFGAEAKWTNTSKDIMTQEWSCDGYGGEKLTSEVYDLVTPGYIYGHSYEAPVLTGKFESRSATYQTRYPAMQAGGRLRGTGKDGYDGPLGVASYDFLDPKGTLAQNSSQIAFHADLNEQWELVMGRLPGSIEVLGLGNVYPVAPKPYGFDYVDIFAQIVPEEGDKLYDETALAVTVFRLPEDEWEETATVIGYGLLTGAEINELPDLEPGISQIYKNLRFNLEVPVVADGNILVLLTPSNIVGDDKIVFPYMKSEDNDVWGNSVAYLLMHDNEEAGGDYDTFYNLNAFPMASGHFAGLTMSLGAVYSYMSTDKDLSGVLEIPTEGGEYTLDIIASSSPEEWVVTTDHITPSSWVKLSAVLDDKIITERADLYHVTLTFPENTSAEDIETPVFITQNGAQIRLDVRQEGDHSGVAEVVSKTGLKIVKSAGKVTVDGVEGGVTLYDAAGAKMAEKVGEGSVEFETAGLAPGVYVVRNGKSVAKVII